jgi:hypothetical protein
MEQTNVLNDRLDDIKADLARIYRKQDDMSKAITEQAKQLAVLNHVVIGNGEEGLASLRRKVHAMWTWGRGFLFILTVALIPIGVAVFR